MSTIGNRISKISFMMPVSVANSPVLASLFVPLSGEKFDVARGADGALKLRQEQVLPSSGLPSKNSLVTQSNSQIFPA